MEKIATNKFDQLSDSQLQMIEGGGIWNRWKDEKNDDGTICWTERHNWFGLHATGDVKDVQVDV